MAELGTGKSVVVLAIVVGCFSVLWPKIFYPMMQTALSLTAPKYDAEDEGHSRNPPHLHLPPRMREAMGEARPDLPPFHPSSHVQGASHRTSAGPPHLMKDGRPFPHPSTRQPPKPQPKTGGAMSIVMPIYTIGIVGFFLYTLLKLLFKKRNEDQSDQQPIIPNYHMDPNYHRYILGNDRPNNNFKQQQPQQQQPSTGVSTGGSSKTFVNESKTKRYLEEFGKQKEDLEILKLKRKLQETEDALQQILEKVSANMNRAISTPFPSSSSTTTANDTEVENYDAKCPEDDRKEDGEQTAAGEEADGKDEELSSQDPPSQEGSKVEDIEVPNEKTELLDEEMNQKEASSNSSPDTESYELIGCPQDDSGRSESEGSEKSATDSTSTLRQRFVHDTTAPNDEARNRSYKLSDILQF